MELDSAFGLTEVIPGKQAETEVDRGRVEAEPASGGFLKRNFFFLAGRSLGQKSLR